MYSYILKHYGWNNEISITELGLFLIALVEKQLLQTCVFHAKFLLDGFDFSSDFYALDFLRFA